MNATSINYRRMSRREYKWSDRISGIGGDDDDDGDDEDDEERTWTRFG